VRPFFPLVAYSGGNWIGSWVKYMLQFVFLAALLFAPRIQPAHKSMPAVV
jgi:hypothetical protein